MAEIHDHPHPLIAQGNEIELPLHGATEGRPPDEETLSPAFDLGPGVHRAHHAERGEQKRYGVVIHEDPSNSSASKATTRPGISS